MTYNPHFSHSPRPTGNTPLRSSDALKRKRIDDYQAKDNPFLSWNKADLINYAISLETRLASCSGATQIRSRDDTSGGDIINSGWTLGGNSSQNGGGNSFSSAPPTISQPGFGYDPHAGIVDFGWGTGKNSSQNVATVAHVAGRGIPPIGGGDPALWAGCDFKAGRKYFFHGYLLKILVDSNGKIIYVLALSYSQNGKIFYGGRLLYLIYNQQNPNGGISVNDDPTTGKSYIQSDISTKQMKLLDSSIQKGHALEPSSRYGITFNYEIKEYSACLSSEDGDFSTVDITSPIEIHDPYNPLTTDLYPKTEGNQGLDPITKNFPLHQTLSTVFNPDTVADNKINQTYDGIPGSVYIEKVDGCSQVLESSIWPFPFLNPGSPSIYPFNASPDSAWKYLNITEYDYFRKKLGFPPKPTKKND